MEFGTNSSPMRGQDGKLVTARVIEERLFEETQRDVSLKYKRVPNTETWVVSGRGELHLGVLIETMRREGYELEVSQAASHHQRDQWREVRAVRGSCRSMSRTNSSAI
jgi:GTP-binding protein